MPDTMPKEFIDNRPWGKFIQYTHNQSTTVKIIAVEKGQRLSLQSHSLRDEWWVPLEDGLVAEINGEEKIMVPEKPLWIPRGTLHRVKSEKTARFLEIAFGEFDELDIVRFDDAHGRK